MTSFMQALDYFESDLIKKVKTQTSLICLLENQAKPFISFHKPIPVIHYK